MQNLSDEIFETKYREFLGIRAEWLSIVKASSIYSDEMIDGSTARFIGMTTSPQTINRARELLVVWEQFAQIAESKREAGIQACSTVLYSPVPTIVSDFTRFAINQFNATSVGKIRKEELLHKLKKRLDNAKRNTFSNPYNIPEIERDIATFTHYPEGTMFRLRIGGYSDIFVDFFKDNAPDQTQRVRVASNGILIDARNAQKHRKDGEEIWEINNGSKIKYDSVYKQVTPLRCSLYANGELYLLDEIEKIKEQMKKENKVRARERNAVRRRKIKTEPASAIQGN